MQCPRCLHESSSPPEQCPRCAARETPSATTAPIPPPPIPINHQMMFVNGLPPVSEHARWFSVKFGDWMGYHACNFIAKGQIGFEGDLFTLRGSRHWVTWQRALMFVGIMFAPLVVGMLIGPIPAYIISHYVCVSKATESFHLGRVQGVKRQKRKVIVKIAKENGKTQQAVIYGLNEEDARSIAELFETRGHPITAQR